MKRKKLVLRAPDGHAGSASLVLDGKDISDLVTSVTVTVSVDGEATAVVELAHFHLDVQGRMVIDLLPDELDEEDIESDE